MPSPQVVVVEVVGGWVVDVVVVVGGWVVTMRVVEVVGGWVVVVVVVEVAVVVVVVIVVGSTSLLQPVPNHPDAHAQSCANWPEGHPGHPLELGWQPALGFCMSQHLKVPSGM